MTHTAQELNERIDHMIDFVNQANAQAESGTLADLSDLDKNVTQLCDDVEASSPDVAREVSDKMAEMIAALEELATALKKYQAAGGGGQSNDNDS